MKLRLEAIKGAGMASASTLLPLRSCGRQWTSSGLAECSLVDGTGEIFFNDRVKTAWNYAYNMRFL